MSLNRYSPWSLVLEGASPVAVPFMDQSLEIGNDAAVDEMMGGGRQAPNRYQIVKKRPFCRFDTTNLSILSPLSWTYYGSGETITQVQVYYRRRIENAQWDSTYVSFISDKGIIIPTAINGDMSRPAVASFLVLPIFTSSVGWTIGTASDARAAVTKAFFPYSLSLAGSLAQLALRSFAWQLQIEVDDDDQYEPAHFLYENLRQSLRATCKDVAQVTLARLEANSAESVSIVWRNRNASEDITQSIGACAVRASTSGRDTIIEAQTTDNA